MSLRRWIQRIRRRRTIQVTTSGKWFLTLTIVFGVAAVLSGNGVLYLLESLLLGFLILSGVLSDRMLWALDARWIESPVHARSPLADQILLTNRSRIPALAIEFGEWTDRGFEVRGYVPFLKGRSSTAVRLLERPYPARGRFSWTGRVMATRFPFGFARKIRWVGTDGERWIRPAYDPARADARDLLEGLQGNIQGSNEIQDGSVRPYLTGDDPRDIAWIYSDRLLGPHVQRVRARLPEPVRLELKCDGLGAAALEAHLSELATELVRARNLGAPIELHHTSRSDGSRLLIDEIDPALDWLARVEPGEEP